MKLTNLKMRLISGALCASMLICTALPAMADDEFPETGVVYEEYTEPVMLNGEYNGIKSPRIKTDSAMQSGQVVSWDLVCFGTYPQREVEPGSYLYDQLNAAGGWSASNDLRFNGVTYRRMRKSDAVNPAPASYSWSDAYSWHYFIYDPVLWRVMDVSGTEALLISDDVLDDHIYSYSGNTWADSALRGMLSDDFIPTAFDANQQSALKYVNSDRVYILSDDELFTETYGFSNSSTVYDEARRCQASTYAKARGVQTDFGNTCRWWVSTPGYGADKVAVADYSGTVNTDGVSGSSEYSIGVRPVIRLDLTKTNVYTKTGVTSSKGGGEGIENSFADVRVDDWFFLDVQYVNSNGIMTGYNSYTFGSYDLMDRSMFATVIYRMQKADPVEYSNIPFPDVDWGLWYTDPIMWA
ncbi:MAG: hypothetical protein HUJ76_12795, partial [Parasporobacterium sp.]|nr:hypothetical protein [Parasporobacterium sp.]